MSELYEKAISQCRLMLDKIDSDEDIWNVIKMITSLPPYKDLDQSKIFNELSTIYNTRVDEFQILSDKEKREPWLNEFKANHEKDYWKFWNRYKKYLIEGEGFAPIIVQKIDDLTNTILDHLFNPQRTDIQIAKKGLVVGHVQSGKTANYTGLICKAADAGFNVIIILAGIHNNLRSQTQVRIDEGFLGFDTSSDKNYQTRLTSRVGVGVFSGFDDAVAHSYTTSLDNGDFTSGAANAMGLNFNTAEPIIFVVKKNPIVLKRLYKWLEIKGNGQKITQKSLLLIDDEADNASINTKKDPTETPTTINKDIRKIIDLFSRSTYVGYTATPFANIFIAPDVENDLFPRDFIINLPAPSNYIGPDKVFGTSLNVDENDDDLLPIVTTIDDYEQFIPEHHKKDDIKPTYNDIPQSLKTAIKCFIITCAIRVTRGQEHKHNSMLIHISRFQSWQNIIKDLVERQFNFYKQEIEAGDAQIIEELRRIFEDDSSNYLSYKTISSNILNSQLKNIDNNMQIHSWDEVKVNLYKVVQKIKVKSINGSSGDILDYESNKKTGLSVIAIGGDKLSRGLTLEGLSVSYFLRASKMYDTLMQMGRWFGYRLGYVDLCRLFTSSELNEWFRHISLASEELREEFNYLAESGGTPNDYRLKVRTHPGRLQITALNKMYNSEKIEVSWSGRLVETYQLSRSRSDVHRNLIVTENFISQLGGYETKNERRIWRNISPDVICDYFADFILPTNFRKVNLEYISEYIRDLSKQGELTSWSIALMSKEDAETTYTFSNGLNVGCYQRTRATDIENSSNNIYYIKKNRIVVGQSDEFIDLSEGLLDKALEETMQRKEKDGNGWKFSYPSPAIVREEFRDKTNPLLMIYPLNPKYANVLDKQGHIIDGTDIFEEHDEPFIGFAISFPKTSTGKAIAYQVNTVKDIVETEEIFDNDNDVVYGNE